MLVCLSKSLLFFLIFRDFQANEVQSNEIEEEIGGEDEDEDESTLQEAVRNQIILFK